MATSGSTTTAPPRQLTTRCRVQINISTDPDNAVMYAANGERHEQARAALRNPAQADCYGTPRQVLDYYRDTVRAIGRDTFRWVWLWWPAGERETTIAELQQVVSEAEHAAEWRRG